MTSRFYIIHNKDLNVTGERFHLIRNNVKVVDVVACLRSVYLLGGVKSRNGPQPRLLSTELTLPRPATYDTVTGTYNGHVNIWK